jgi:hypothetical protein
VTSTFISTQPEHTIITTRADARMEIGDHESALSAPAAHLDYMAEVPDSTRPVPPGTTGNIEDHNPRISRTTRTRTAVFPKN